MKLYSIVYGKMLPTSIGSYFPTYDHEGEHDLILRLACERGWYEIVPRRIIKRVRWLEQALNRCGCGTRNEWRLLKKYFDIQEG